MADKQSGGGKVGEWLEVVCVFEGYPRPNITWLHQGSPVRENQIKYEITEDYGSDKVGLHHKLII